MPHLVGEATGSLLAAKHRRNPAHLGAARGVTDPLAGDREMGRDGAPRSAHGGHPRAPRALHDEPPSHARSHRVQAAATACGRSAGAPGDVQLHAWSGEIHRCFPQVELSRASAALGSECPGEAPRMCPAPRKGQYGFAALKVKQHLSHRLVPYRTMGSNIAVGSGLHPFSGRRPKMYEVRTRPRHSRSRALRRARSPSA